MRRSLTTAERWDCGQTAAAGPGKYYVGPVGADTARQPVISAADGGWSRVSRRWGDASANFYPVMLVVARLLTYAYVQWALCMAHCLVDKSFQFNETVWVNLRHDS